MTRVVTRVVILGAIDPWDVLMWTAEAGWFYPWRRILRLEGTLWLARGYRE